MLKAQKAELVQQIRDRFARMSSAVFLDYQGMTVAEVSKLRDAFRQRRIDYRVVKNTLVRQALSGQSWAKRLDDVLSGMTAVAWSFEEPSAAARAIKEFRRENEKLKIKAGLLEGVVLGAEAVESQLASLPNKDEARAMLLATMLAPAQRLLMLLNTPARNMVGVLAAKQRHDETA